MKVIFLDVDGVLNCHETFVAHMHERRALSQAAHSAGLWRGDAPSPEFDEHHFKWRLLQLCDERVRLLSQIVDATNAVVVLSSAWRMICSLDMMRRLLAAKGFRGKLIARTPIRSEMLRTDGPRGVEVGLWINQNPDVESWVVLDDLGPESFPSMEDRCVTTSMETGLLPEHVGKAIEILRRSARGAR